MNNEFQSTTDTAYGPAQFTASADGLLCLTWQAGVSINRVEYGSASTYQTRSEYTGSLTTHVYLSRADWTKQPSGAALSALRQEAERLTPLLITPEAVARARVWGAQQLTQRTQREHDQAAEAHARALAEYAAARAALAHLLVLASA